MPGREEPIVINLVLRDRPAQLNQNPESGLLSCAWDRSSEWGLNVIRTFWLGFIFLIVLAGVGSFRLAFGNFDAANASAISRPDYIVVARSAQPSSLNTEPLPAPFGLPAPTLAETTVNDTSEVDAAESDTAVKDENIWPELPPQTLPALVATGNPGPDWRDASALEPRQRTEHSQPRPAGPRQKKMSEPQQRTDQKAVRKPLKKEAVVNKDQESAEPKTCQADDFDALRWAFKLPTGCWS